MTCREVEEFCHRLTNPTFEEHFPDSDDELPKKKESFQEKIDLKNLENSGSESDVSSNTNSESDSDKDEHPTMRLKFKNRKVVSKKSLENKEIVLDGQNVSVQDIFDIATHHTTVKTDSDTKNRMNRSRKMLENLFDKEPIYGVTTGYGPMVHCLLKPDEANKLQTNGIRSLAAGIGQNFTLEESRAILAVRINALCRGFSAVKEELVDRLILYLNNGIIPVIPEIGSVGASGDLNQLAHLALPVIGEGYVYDEKFQPVSTMKILEEHDIKPLKLSSKEGLALVNGTSAMSGIGCLVLSKAKIQVKQAEIITAMFLENQYASMGAFEPEGHELGKPHPGQITCASNIRNLLDGSDLVFTHQQLKTIFMHHAESNDHVSSKYYLQKAYTLRCIPQIFGAIRDTLDHVEKVLTIEINSSNDNPLFFEGKEVFHGGNFHGQQVAFVMDFMSIALAQLGVVAERQLNRLLDSKLNTGLPEFLSLNPGLSCGFEGVQFPATALVAENRSICHPASIQSISCNEDNQDVVSMGLTAARKARQILKNNNYILAIELMSVCQAIDLAQQFQKLSSSSQAVYKLVRSLVSFLKEDRYMSNDIQLITELLDDGKILTEVTNIGLELK